MAQVTVLGSCRAWPEPGRACAGFLLSHNGFRLVLDLGYGAAPRLFEHGLPDAVIVTHEHPDHCADVSALGRAWHYTVQAQAPEGARPRLPLHCTPGTVRRLAALEPRPDPAELFEVHDLGAPATIGPFRLTPHQLPHHVPNFGVRLTAPGLTLAYTGDTGPTSRLAALGRDADLFICDATLRTPPREEPRYLITATEAGRCAPNGQTHAVRCGSVARLRTPEQPPCRPAHADPARTRKAFPTAKHRPRGSQTRAAQPAVRPSTQGRPAQPPGTAAKPHPAPRPPSEHGPQPHRPTRLQPAELPLETPRTTAAHLRIQLSPVPRAAPPPLRRPAAFDLTEFYQPPPTKTGLDDRSYAH